MGLVSAASLSQTSAVDAREIATSAYARLEARSGGRLGVCVIDAVTHRRRQGYRTHERFPMCSTFKTLAVGAVLARVDAGMERLERRVGFGTADLLTYAPIARAHVARGAMSVAELCAAALEWSDNTAANLLLASFGGPAHVTHYVRSLGDRVTRLDRNEPALNTAIAGDVRDTTTPQAIALTYARLVVGNALSARSRDLLQTWLISTQTGKDRLRAGLDAHWRIGDKTGTGDNGTANDIAVVWPPDRTPSVLVAYLTGSTASSAHQNATLAAVARVAAGVL